MPRKTKETDEIKNNNTKTNLPKSYKNLSKSSPSNTTKSNNISTSENKKTSKKPKKSSSTNTSKTKNNTSKNVKSKPVSSTLKKSSSSKPKTIKKVNSKTSKSKKTNIIEYYDLPYRYNQTVVKVLAQTPNNLFIYWDISDKDRDNYKKQYGENFFETTKPILIVHNDTLGYSFEIEINDFANSWYLHVSDSKCDYRIELGRRPIVKTEKINTDYIYISTSNKIDSPNDHILFNKEQKMVYFRNVKTGKQTQKPTTSLSFIRNMGKIYNIYDFYKAIYPNENIEELYDLSNPSSGNPSSRKLFI